MQRWSNFGKWTLYTQSILVYPQHQIKLNKFIICLFSVLEIVGCFYYKVERSSLREFIFPEQAICLLVWHITVLLEWHWHVPIKREKVLRCDEKMMLNVLTLRGWRVLKRLLSRRAISTFPLNSLSLSLSNFCIIIWRSSQILKFKPNHKFFELTR